jgi:dTDP-4-dehydrorhamnose 3,5-epimerase|tara:strand:- start:11582 stop:11977 length:396 start_codon:yes stop_codon:yes gene_type:complete
MDFHEDDRAQRLFDVFPKVNGQINISHVNSTNHVVAWHKHKIQTDFWFCVKGSFKVGLAEPQDDGSYKIRWEYISDKNQRILEIPPGTYHGYKALQPESIILYHLTEKYDPSDEWKVLPGHFGEDWETESK